MSLLLFAQSFVFCCEIFFGIYVLFLNKKAAINRVFFMWSIAACFWTISITLMSRSGDMTELMVNYKLTFGFFMPFEALFLHFSMQLVYERLKPLHYVAIYLIPLLLVSSIFSGFVIFQDFHKVNGLWLCGVNFNSGWTILFFLYRQIVFWGSIILLIRWRKKCHKNRERRQGLVLIGTLVFIDVFAISSFFAFQNTATMNPMVIAPLFNFVWIGGVFYSITNYQFMKLTPVLVVNRVLNHIEECILLLDENQHVIFMNKKADDLLDYKKLDSLNKHFSHFVLEYSSVEKVLDDVLCSENLDFSCRIHLVDSDTGALLIDAKFSKVCDKYNDSLGILMIGHEVKEIRQFKQHFKITQKETEIIQLMIIGKTNAEIAERFGISLRTVKTHITNIYNKLKVNNKIAMIDLLKEYHLVPEQTSSRIILPIQYK